jgi:hypothetical protein
MSLDHNAPTQFPVDEEPTVADAPPTEAPPRFAGEETVPLRDSAASALDRERAERVRTVVGRRRRGSSLPHAGRRPVTIALVCVAALALVAVIVTGGGASTPSRPAASSPVPSAPAPHLGPATTQRTTVASPRPHARRRADQAAERRTARRRPHRRRGPHAAGRRRARHPRSRTPRHRPAEANASASEQPQETVEPTSDPTRVEPDVTEPAPIESVPPPAPPPPEPQAESPPAEPEPAAQQTTTAPSRTPAESEFDFER